MKKLLAIACQLLAISAIAQIKDTVKPMPPNVALHLNDSLRRDSSNRAMLAIVKPAPPFPDTSLHIYAPAVVRNTEDKLNQYQRYNHGTSPGYRVQVNFSQEKNAVDKMQSDFAGKHPGVPSYVTYNQPYFRLSVGDFRSRLQAIDFLDKLRKEYPGAFVVSARIMPPQL